MAYDFGNNFYSNGESSTSSNSSFFDSFIEDKNIFNSSVDTNNLRELQSIVGSEVSLPDLENLWNASSGNLEKAVNSYFDNNMNKENLVMSTPTLRRNANY